MPQSKKTPVKSKKKPDKKTAASKTPDKIKKSSAQRKPPDPDSIFNRVMPYILVVLSIFIAVCFILEDMTGSVGNALRVLLYGLFSAGAWLVPALILLQALLWKKDVSNGETLSKFIFGFIVLTFFAVLLHIIYIQSNGILPADATLNIKELWSKGFGEDGFSLVGGGAVGGFVATLLLRLFGIAGTLIITIALLFVFTVFLFGLTPRALGIYIAYYWHKNKEKRAEKREAGRERLKSFSQKYTPSTAKDTHKIDECANEKEDKQDLSIDTLEASEDLPPFDIDVDIFAEESSENQGNEGSDGNTKTKLSEIFADEAEPDIHEEKNAVPNAAELELMIERKKLSKKLETNIEQEEIPETEYVFPPVSLLNPAKNLDNIDISDELHKNAVKLVETLASFRVRTKIVNVSRGPTVTRYELSPEEGIRVRSIANLVDDIALNLATTGVRIEAPIPGKSAVGIEVPNRVVETVYLRELVDKSYFKTAAGKLTVALGENVAGEAIYLDIAKMPHLLIAGATGMGKSVCINSIIISLLYKATPSEVKLILVDPKKVELSIYNGIPHLLVPVVSDPKKAAGSLHWAVTEMERRFELIEDVGMRDVASYNKITANDPEKEFLPQIVIIIDELADLMMTAPDDVEESICRLAQKARAAGMHLVIGTQRPSVDVITGLIKANVPSRIAFTMASQIDSRTILDIAGAEKLIGRGDMLYAPVGLSKPIRVQGSFVSEGEVERVVEFLKKNIGVSEYDGRVIDQIEKEAARCGLGKRAAAEIAEDGESDSMLKPAIELAIESGKISTSLIQRRLSLGYGRAAKLIDKMEQLGYVSPPEGQKPRSVLITKQQYMEMVLKQDEFE